MAVHVSHTFLLQQIAIKTCCFHSNTIVFEGFSNQYQVKSYFDSCCFRLNKRSLNVLMKTYFKIGLQFQTGGQVITKITKKRLKKKMIKVEIRGIETMLYDFPNLLFRISKRRFKNSGTRTIGNPVRKIS